MMGSQCLELMIFFYYFPLPQTPKHTQVKSAKKKHGMDGCKQENTMQR